MTGESSGDDGDTTDGEGTDGDGEEQRSPSESRPTERDIEAAREELAAVGSEADENLDSTDDISSNDDEAEQDPDADLDSVTEDELPAGGERASEDEQSSDGPPAGDDSASHSANGSEPDSETDGNESTGVDVTDSDEDGAVDVDTSEDDEVDADSDRDDADNADADGATHAEDLVETPADRDAAESSDSASEDAATEVDDPDDQPEDDAAAADDADASADAVTVAEATDGDATDAAPAADGADDGAHQPGVPEDVRKYDRFKKVDGAQYDRVNEFLRDRTYITAREWAIARLCSDFRTETGVEMTKIGENLPELVPFMTDTYTAQAVNQARASFEDKVRTAGATFLYGAMCDFFTAEQLDDVMYESTEVAKFLLEVEGVELSVEEELEAEDRISTVMREVRESSAELRHESCPECGAHLTGDD